MEKKRISYLDGLRALATICVVLIHTIVLNEDALSSPHRGTLTFYHNLLLIRTPIFVMITGALLLHSSNVTGYKSVMKYVRRIVLALVVFGLPMCAIELIFSQGLHLSIIVDTLINWVTGHSWAHMWYLYMLIGLYLITPIIKPFVEGASNKELKIALGVLFVLSSLMPALENMGIELSGYMVTYTPYVFIYILGYYLCWRASSEWTKNKWILSAIILVGVVVVFLESYDYIDSEYGYPSVSLICQSVALFLLFKSINVNSKLAERLTPYCFGIYLVHPFFTNFAYKVLGMSCETVVPLYNWLGIGFLFYFLSLFSTYLLRKIPLLKKYIL